MTLWRLILFFSLPRPRHEGDVRFYVGEKNRASLLPGSVPNGWAQGGPGGEAWPGVPEGWGRKRRGRARQGTWHPMWLSVMSPRHKPRRDKAAPVSVNTTATMPSSNSSYRNTQCFLPCLVAWMPGDGWAMFHVSGAFRTSHCIPIATL